MKICMVGRRLVTIFLLFFGPPPKKKTPPPTHPLEKAGLEMWRVEPLAAKGSSEALWFGAGGFATNLFFLKNLSENIHDATKMVPNQPKKSLKHLGSCESFILPIWQGVLFEGPFLKDLTSTPPCTSEDLKLEMELQKTFCAALAMKFFERCKF